jgi:hypothetical protein
VGARTDAARAEVLASRGDLGGEIELFRAAARDAVDIPAKVKRAPGRAAAVAAGSAFVVLGGPRRIVRRLKRAVRGPQPELPASMLPDEVEAALAKLGPNGAAVRGTIEREFAAYLEQTSDTRASRDVRAALAESAAFLIRRASRTVGPRLIARLLTDDSTSHGSAFAALRRAASPGTKREGPPPA